ncbi:hypothetical protein KEM09_17395 [Carboxylicivirga mesophila]|uniref:Bacteriocin n=1 Tax=Carboxylicivirga mesophila TaxID=1166478 RepID=A0ABS5KE91_9BACT|nr:hypothetical protein [Carboxylicivirga mesophila]MBS2213192.1 hypothetical protein [Carboxylicivirga mesophila]
MSESLKLKKDEKIESNVLGKNDLLSLKGGLTRAEFLESYRWLVENGHHDQAAEIMKMANSGMIEFEDSSSGEYFNP